MANGPRTILHVLERTATEFPNHGVTVFESNRDATIFSSYEKREGDTTFLSYAALFDGIKLESKAIQGLIHLRGNRKSQVFVLHIDNHLEGLHWFWSIVAAGGLPCIAAFSNDIEQRQRQIANLHILFNSPIFITSERLRPKFEAHHTLTFWTFTEFERCRARLEQFAGNEVDGFLRRSSDTAVLMLTSGSTGDSKAVALKHKHILAAVKGKSAAHHMTKVDKFLNWTGLDHVANLTEVHIQALALGANQFHMPTANFLSSPRKFLECISNNRISYTFAPNFFLGLLRDELQRPITSEEHDRYWVEVKVVGEDVDTSSVTEIDGLDLSCLRALISGGEANVVASCVTVEKLLGALGAPKSFIRPGFGMTETCAGSIYNAWDCPEYDVAQGVQFAGLGKPIPGMEMRISNSGELQVRGANIFEEYFNDAPNTVLAFTSDGWFRTGDTGMIDNNGRLRLTGRDKDMVIINGVSIHPQAIENAIEDTKIPFITPTYTVVFSHRSEDSSTEVVVVVYLLDSEAQPADRVLASRAISKAVVKFCGVRPFKIISLDPTQLQKTSLGKLSRSKLRKSFESGAYAKQIEDDEDAAASFQDVHREAPTSFIQAAILESCEAIFEGSMAKIGISQDLLQLGLSSIDLLRLKMRLQNRLNVVDIPITTLFSHSVIKDLATQLESIVNSNDALTGQVSQYNPIVALQPHGEKTPLFLFHPGLGEVLVFMNLVRYITDRPVYALRARGFDGEPLFNDLEDAVTVYHNAIRNVQPEGPYAFAGYSFGSFLAFETTKRMTAAGEDVKFLASFDQAPFCKERARTYDWYVCLLSIAFFMDLVSEEYAYSILPEMRKLPHIEVLDHIFSLAPPDRVEELSLTKEKLDRWAKVALNFKTITVDYDPAPAVRHMDVFYTKPLIGHVQAKDTKEWFDGFISRWDEVVEEPRFHEVGGGHRAIISPPNVAAFQAVFKQAMADRDV